ncbi:MAG: trigger factor [Bryobacterales bacterium]|nr:trigger factor [Bryobacterales bacterium]
MAHIEGCKHQLEITIPADAVAAETDKVAAKIQKQAHLPGFRPGKAPLSMIRSRFDSSIRQDVVENLVPKFFKEAADKENLDVVGQPTLTDIHHHDGGELHFKIEFEVSPTVEVKEYRGLPVTYVDPVITDEALEARLQQLRESKAEYVNLDPREAAEGDVAVVSLESVSGLEGEPMKANDLKIELGSPQTLPAFNEIVGMEVGDAKKITVEYPEEYGQERLAGKKVDFIVTLDGLQRKELPELNDEFAKDLGDFQSMDELRDTVRRNMHRELEMNAQRAAKDQLVDKFADQHDFAVPEAYVDRQVEIFIQRFAQEQGVDINKMKLDPARIKEAMRDRAVKEVRTSLILEKIGDTENIQATQEEVDSEVQRFSKQQREPIAAVRKRFEENGTMARIANAIRTEKVLNFLFENARKEAPSADDAPAETPAAEASE